MTQETSHATNARILAETHFEISEFLKLFSPLLERHLIGEGRQRSFSRLALSGLTQKTGFFKITNDFKELMDLRHF